MLKKIEFHFAVGFLLRVIFTLYGLYHDNYAEQANNRSSAIKSRQKSPTTKGDNLVIPKYTDIDYLFLNVADE